MRDIATPPAADAGDQPRTAAESEPRTPRGRRRLFVALVVVCAAVAAVAIVTAAGAPDDAAPASARQLLAHARTSERPIVLFRALARDGAAAGRLAISPLDRLARRAPAPLRCDRLHFAGGVGLCVARGSAFAAGYRATIFGAELRERGGVDLAGTPSRARVSRDGRRAAVTQFVTGHSYAEEGSFSTQTTLIDLESAARIADLEDFAVLRGQRLVTAVDVNFWGVTFARDSDRFYATLATGGKTYLVRGSIAARRMRVIRENVECPSLSPDGTRLAYKKRVRSDAGPWRLHVLDLATMRDTALAETRSVDDQVEWLDDGDVLYGVDGAVWTTRADGSGRANRFLVGASSPAVVRW